jgi:mannonate dehydratase
VKLAELLNAYPDRQWMWSKQVGVKHAIGRLPVNANGAASWDFMDLLHMKTRFEDFGLKLEVLEPGYEALMNNIKLGTEQSDDEIEKVKMLIRHMGKLGIPVLCYNFMAYFNWIRTSLSVPTRGGALVTGYDHSLLEDAPPTEAGTVTEDELWTRLERFLKQVVPVAEEAKVKLALHPDDPPISPIRGISRIITSTDAIQRVLDLVPSEFSGVTLCQGTISASGEDVIEAIRKFGQQGKIFYVHFRDVRGGKEKFVETFHDDGQTDMFEAIRTYRSVGFDGPVRVDHVPTMDGEDNASPGYAAVGRLYALGYLRGLLEGAGYEMNN